MFKKYFYLVRHGETVLNAAKIRQGSEGRLSENGIRQVNEAAERFSKIKIEKCFVSPFERTRETFDIINQRLKIDIKNENKVIFTPLLAERKNPTPIIGKSYDDPVTKNFIDIMDKSFHHPDLRIYDEENFADLRDRSIECQKFLIENGAEKNLCVTHGIFLKMFLSTLIYGKDLPVPDYIEMNEYNSADNAAMTLVSFDIVKDRLNKILKRNPYEDRENNP
jgi:broad specificity phosphatase PhoE